MVYRIDDVTAVSALPALPTDNIGTPGFFTGGSTSGQSPTRVRFWWLNMVQEELVNIAEAAGIVFDKTKNDQCITAIKQLISGVASSAVMGTPGVLADGDVAGKLLYYAANQKAPVFVYGSTTVALATTTAMTSALSNYLSLTGGNVTGAVAFSGANTHSGTETFTGVVNSNTVLNLTAPNAGDTCLFVSGKYIANMAEGTTWVGDPAGFQSIEALNTRSAEGRYVKSVPDASTTNKRITDIWEDADGRTVTGDGSGSNVLASLSDLPTQFNGVDSSGRGYGYQKFNDGTMIVFGYAYYQKSTGTTGTVVTLPFSFPGKFIGLNCTDVGNDNNAVAAYPESQSSFRCWGGAPTISYLNTEFYYSARGTWK